MTHRRGKGEGAVYQRPDGLWTARLDLGWVQGRRVRKAFYGPTKRDVSDQLTAARNNLGLLPTAKEQTLGQFLAHWLTTVAKEQVRPSTYRSYEGIVRLYLVPGLGRVRLSKLTPQQVQAWLTRDLPAPRRPHEQTARMVSPQLKRYARAVLRSALTQAQTWQLVSVNAAALTRPPRVERHSITPLTPDQARIVIDAADTSRLGALVCTALALGLRLGEALALRWQDVDLDSRELRIERTLHREGRTVTFAEPKSETSRRTVPVPDVLVKRLTTHRREQRERQLAAGGAWSNVEDLVFTSRTGTALSPRTVLRDTQRWFKRLGVPVVRFHDLRHSCATLLLVQGVAPRVIMETLGHSQISLTLNTYSHVLPNLQRDAADSMDRALTGTKSTG